MSYILLTAKSLNKVCLASHVGGTRVDTAGGRSGARKGSILCLHTASRLPRLFFRKEQK